MKLQKKPINIKKWKYPLTGCQKLENQHNFKPTIWSTLAITTIGKTMSINMVLSQSIYNSNVGT